MGYNIYITRQENWFDDNEDLFISMEEWKNYLSIDDEMRLDGYAQASTPSGDLMKIEREGIAIWKNYSHNEDGNYAWFHYDKGNIAIKNSD